ncbi:MAG: hypothetical protein MMC33_004703 [Icmadophila ericetorum]|nr:hypothetical protein [Icmadophila ericetorum]
MSSQTIKSVLLLLFPGFNTLDANGPLEIFGNGSLRSEDHPDGYFQITIAAADEFTKAAEGLTVKSDISTQEIIDKNMIENYDMLIVPGGPMLDVMRTLEIKSSFMNVISQFAQEKARHPEQKAIILSVCSGAFFLGNLGILDGLKATTHWSVLEQLKLLITNYVSEQQKEGKSALGTIVSRERYIDNGYDANNVRVVTAGGVSCGLDASIYLISDLIGREEARTIANIIDYAWRGLS